MHISLPSFLLYPLLLLPPSSQSTSPPPPPSSRLPQDDDLPSTTIIESILSIDSFSSSSSSNLPPVDDATHLWSPSPPSLDEKSTYILCCHHSTTTTTGHSCRETLEPIYGYALTPISNTVSQTCFYSYTPFISMNDVSVTIQWVEPQMKLGLGTWDATAAVPLPERYDVFLSPGVTESTEEVSDVAWHMIQDVMSSSDDCIDFYEMVSVEPIDASSFAIRLSPTSLTSHPTCSREMVKRVVTFHEVAMMGYVPSFRPMNVQAQWIVQSDDGGESDPDVDDARRPWFEEGLDGRGQVVAASDTGLDVDNCYFWEGRPRSDEDVSLAVRDEGRRKVVHYEPYADDGDVKEGHGTHVVGTICGRRLVESGEGESDGDADGVARGAKVAFFDVGLGNSTTLSIPSSPHTLFHPGLSAGAAIHTISWGSSQPYEQGTYGPLERAFDRYLYDLSLEDNDLLVVAAAGNFGEMEGDDSSGTIVMPAVAKNVLTVGSSQSAGPDLTKEMQGKNYLSDFSSRGPTHDHRLKPELVTPGYFLLSASSHPTSPGSCDATSGVRFDAGTSMSAAVASGAAALVRQYVQEGYYPGGTRGGGPGWNPSAALVKSVLINGGVDLEGVQENDGKERSVTSYDENQGFGRVSLARALPLGKKEKESRPSFDVVMRDRRVLENGEEETLTLYFDDGCGRSSNGFSATLVWMDPPGVPFCRKCTLNHLNLVVKHNGTKIDANGYEADDDGSSSDDDDEGYVVRDDNSQRVRVGNATKDDKFVIKVKATNLVTRNQMYSLVVTGCFRRNDDEDENDEMVMTATVS